MVFHFDKNADSCAFEWIATSFQYRNKADMGNPFPTFVCLMEDTESTRRFWQSRFSINQLFSGYDIGYNQYSFAHGYLEFAQGIIAKIEPFKQLYFVTLIPCSIVMDGLKGRMHHVFEFIPVFLLHSSKQFLNQCSPMLDSMTISFYKRFKNADSCRF